jgi:hypothetical protein
MAFFIDEKAMEYEFKILKAITDENVDHEGRLFTKGGKLDRYSDILTCIFYCYFR